MKLQIEKLKKSDIENVQKNYRENIMINYLSFFSQETIDSYISNGRTDKEILDNLDNCWVFKSNSRFVGFTIFSDDTIHLIMIKLGFQYFGFGSYLLKFAEKKLSKNNSLIRVETFKENEAAMKLFKKNGWRAKSEIVDKDLGVTRIFLEKRV